MRNTWKWAPLVFVTVALVVAAGCQGSQGDQGPQGDDGIAGQAGDPGAVGPTGAIGTPAPTTGTLTGTVTDGIKLDPLVDVAVTAKDSGGAVVATTTTNSTGVFNLTVPFGTLSLSFSKANYTSPAPMIVGALAGQTVTINVAMNVAASGKPSVSLAASVSGTATVGDVGYGATVTLTATASSPTGATLSYTWSNAGNTSPKLGTVTGSGTSATVTMPTLAQAMAKRYEVGNDGGYVSGYTPRPRLEVLPITTDMRASVSTRVTVTDDRGQSTAVSLGLTAANMATGLRTVALGSRVFLNSGHDTNNLWTLTPHPASGTSVAALDSTSVRYPSFVADKPGTFTVTEGGAVLSDGGTSAVGTLEIYVGDWRGIVTNAGPADGGVANDAGFIASTSVTYDTGCTVCHNGTLASGNFVEWAKSPHATRFARGISTPGSYGANCLTCHTVGNDPAIANGGFDDIATAKAWTIPTPLVATNWVVMESTANGRAVGALSGIQCENCHGPQADGAGGLVSSHTMSGSPDAGQAGVFKAPRIGYSAELCGTCHASGSGHHLYSEWSTVNPVTGVGHSSVKGGNRGASDTGMAPKCVRCHSAQGYPKHLAQLKAGWYGSIPNGINPLSTPADPILTQVTRANVEPVTCTACHDPHSDANAHHLRLVGDSPTLPSGIAAHGLGKGALCATCHNASNGIQGEPWDPVFGNYREVTATKCNVWPMTGKASGALDADCPPAQDTPTAVYRHDDAETWNGGVARDYSYPHHGPQVDVFTGNNAYFMGAALPMVSRHAAIEDTCVGCHMELNPSTHRSHGAENPNGHEFRILPSGVAKLCAECHGELVDGEGTQAAVEAQVHALSKKMADAMKAKILSTGTINVRVGASGAYVKSTIDLSTNPLVSVTQSESSFVLTFTNDLVGSTATNKKVVTLGLADIRDDQASPVPLFLPGSNLYKAMWNWVLIDFDQSKGLHNPTFVMQVLNNTLAKDLTL